MIEQFKENLRLAGKSENTIESYSYHLKGYYQWYAETFALECTMLYRENVLDFISYLRNVKLDSAKTINAKISALIKLNEYLISTGTMDQFVVSKKDKLKIQQLYANPTNINKQEVDTFRQKLLSAGYRDMYCLATILSYAGLRISECLNIRLIDFNLLSGELKVLGKGNKERIIYLNDKITNSIKEHLRTRRTESPYLFANKQNCKIDRSTINKIFKQFSNKITPHSLRHFFCTLALESGFSVHEVSYLAGHSNIHTSLIYLNPSKAAMKNKVSQL